MITRVSERTNNSRVEGIDTAISLASGNRTRWSNLSPRLRARNRYSEAERDKIKVKLRKQVLRAGANDCWLWFGPTLPGGYGKFSISSSGARREIYAHRAAFELENGYLPIVVRHSCDNPSCCNPRHLLGGTHKQNSQDMLDRGRGNPPRGERAAKAKLTKRDIASILRDERQYKIIAAEYGVDRSSISRIKRGEVWAHIDGKRAVTKKNRGADNPRARLGVSTVLEIFRASGTQVEIAKRFGVTQTTVSKIKRREHWASRAIRH